jgi:phenylpropionate dioxygenase-like ring-hydroxylating dioxygenase large terminal subunit
MPADYGDEVLRQAVRGKPMRFGYGVADQEFSSIPPHFYRDPEVAAAEVARIFRTTWIGVGRADLVARAGDFAALDVAGQSLVLVRDHDQSLRAFANTCRHRGARLLDGTGTCRSIRCPFHAWRYSLDGRLVSAPHMEEAADFGRLSIGLIEYRAEVRDGFVFVCLNRRAAPIDVHLGDFSALHAPWPLAALTTFRRRALTVTCNWKAFLEVFNEYYHLPFVHPKSINRLYGRPDAPDATQGAFASQFGATSGTGGLLEDAQANALPAMPGLAGRWAAGVRYTWVFPNMTFAAGADALWVYEAYPLGPDRCHVVQTICFPPETMATPGFAPRAAAYLERADAALEEDIPALENQQRGLACPDARTGALHPLLEPNLTKFATWYAAALEAAET